MHWIGTELQVRLNLRENRTLRHLTHNQMLGSTRKTARKWVFDPLTPFPPENVVTLSSLKNRNWRTHRESNPKPSDP